MLNDSPNSSSCVTKFSTPLLVETLDPEKFALFPTESGGGVVIPSEELLRLSNSYSKLYAIYISRLSVKFVDEFGISAPAAKQLARHVLVPLIHCFMDRLVRVEKAIDAAPCQLTIPRQGVFSAIGTVESFQGAALLNPAFNQYMVWFVGRVWQLPESDPVSECVQFESQVGFKNNLFNICSKTRFELGKRIFRRILTLLPLARFPILTAAYATVPFQTKKFYWKYLEDIGLKCSLKDDKINNKLRLKLFSEELIEHSYLSEFLTGLGLTIKEQSRAKKLLKEFLQLHYPTTLLEALTPNMQQALKTIQPYKKKALITSGGSNSIMCYLVAAAKQLGHTVVDLQHGGHYGYMKDMSPFLELEYPGVDELITWGWSRLPNQLNLQEISVIKLPSPWLSERKLYWKGLTFIENKEFDILMLPNMIKRFPPAPCGASITSIDTIQEVAISIKNFVHQATEKKLSILHKPYNPASVKLLGKTMRELEIIGGSLYHCEQQLDKGLTFELLNRCSVVVWDQPGTGFLECLSSKIPTMVLWPRIFNQEENWVKPIFLELEKKGIIHRAAKTLVEEIHLFKLSPTLWMQDAKRVSLVDRFCENFASTDEKWSVHWRRYLDGLSKPDIKGN